MADRFGTQAFGAILTTLSISSGAASYLLSAEMASAFYQARIPPGGGTVCTGMWCYQDTFIVLACICVVSGGAGVLLSRRLRKLYREDGVARRYSDFVQSP